jgi:hypothetical protein
MAAEPYDEAEIEGNDVIIRRVNPNEHVVPDEKTGRLRTSSKLFSPSSGSNGGMSIDLLKLIESDGLNAREFVTTPVFTGSVCFFARDVREATLRVGYDPIKDVPGIADNPYHGEVWGPDAKPNKFTREQKRSLAKASTWFVELQNVEIKI